MISKKIFLFLSYSFDYYDKKEIVQFNGSEHETYAE